MRFLPALVAALVVAAPAFACQSSKDCSGGNICCFGSFQTGGTFGSAGKSGYCTSRDVCKRESGTSAVYPQGTECGSGLTLCTVTRNGRSVQGCFTPSLCNK